jgi:glutamate N-acetyltransferase / amino-acid N-acetyltransferase
VKVINGSVTAPRDFFAAGINCGIKNNKPDLALIISGSPALAAGVFTKNTVKAAPVVVSEKHRKKGRARAIIANSGNANCLTGKRGMDDAIETAKAVAGAMRINNYNVLVASTGVIGKPLDAGKIKAAVPKLIGRLSAAGELSAAKAIMTTDLCAKRIAVAVKIGERTVKIGGIAKGSGMINPDMATMLCFLTTDADIELKALRRSLRDSVADSFNAVTVDGDMSTNDTVFILANCCAGNPRIRYGTKDYEIFYGALCYVTAYLAKEIARDGEGASKFIEVEVKGAKNKDDAGKIAKGISNSNLVKTAMAGEDPNIGRIASAAGAAGVKFDESKLDISINGIKAVSGGNADYQKRLRVKRSLKKNEIDISVDLHSGNASAKVWTCDLTERYIKINARYN